MIVSFVHQESQSMSLHKSASILTFLAALAAGASTAYASDPCATFFWTASRNSPVDRYKPRYLIGQGLEDVHMDDIAGTRIRYKWSTQAASCIASTASYGYFFHPDFEHTACTPNEQCYPGTRFKRMSERLTDILGVAQQLATPNSDATYQTNLNAARASSYLVIDQMGAAPGYIATFYAGLIPEYNPVIDQVNLALDTALPPNGVTAVLDAMCAPDNVTKLNDLIDACFDRDQYCELGDLYLAMSLCVNYQNGATVSDLISQLTTLRNGLVSERDALASEQASIPTLWQQVQALHPTTAPAVSCNVHFPFGTAQMTPSDFTAGHYGADLKYLYGDWEWPTFGLTSDASKTFTYVQSIAGLVRDCVGDNQYGRLDFRRRQVPVGDGTFRDETDQEYFDRTLDDLAAVRSEFLNMGKNFTALMHTHAPLVADGDIASVKSVVDSTLLRVRDRAANRTTGLGWMITLLQDLLDATNRFTTANTLMHQLSTTYFSQFPQHRDEFIQLLLDSTTGMVNEYGQFFSAEKQANLEELLAEAVAEGDTQDLAAAIVALNGIADDIQTEVSGILDRHQPFGTFASRLKFIFGDCDQTQSPHPLVGQYFPDLPVAALIVQEGDDVPFCNN
jgi:hypothetical protein